MSSAWLLPEHIADVLPSQARRIEELRRELLDAARTYGFELVIPPLLEHLDSLLSGAGKGLGLKTFKLVDQLSGRTLGVRADTTSQVARIDAHLLNRQGVTRLCYCGPVLHTLSDGLHSSREPLQWGAEIYGHAGLEADLEVQELALDMLQRSGVTQLTMDMGDVRIVRGIMGSVVTDPAMLTQIYAALATKDATVLADASRKLPLAVQNGLSHLLQLYGGEEVLVNARKVLELTPLVDTALNDLQWLFEHLSQTYPGLQLSFDLADLSEYAYYSGPRFAIFAAGSGDALVRGGRYDEVGAVFGRSRPAVGFSADLKQWVTQTEVRELRTAIKAPWRHDAKLRQLIRQLREQGESVICVLPGHEDEGQEFNCDRELVLDNDQWILVAL